MSSGLLVSVLIGGLGIGGAVGYVAGAATRSPAPSAPAASTAAANTAWFTYDGKTYDTASLPPQLQTGLYQTELEAYNQKIGIIKEFAVRLALAQEQKKFTTIDKLPNLMELLPPATVSDADAKAFFEANKDKIPPGATYDQLAGRIKELLAQEAHRKTFDATLAKLTNEKKLEILAKEPTAPTTEIPIADYPQRGASGDKNVLVEISDYLCPHCQEVAPEVEKLLAKHGNSVKFVQVNFSLRPEKLSGTLVQGAFCAQKQGNDAFWKYHHAAFSKSWGTFGDEHDIAKVKPVAEAAGLKIPDWEACMNSQEPKDRMNKTRDMVAGLGVTGTPTFYLNNKRLNPRTPAELVTVVEAALAK